MCEKNISTQNRLIMKEEDIHLLEKQLIIGFGISLFGAIALVSILLIVIVGLS